MKTVIDRGYGTMVELHEAVFVSGSIPSSKNSKVATSKGVFHSKTVTKWLREQGIQHYSASKKEVALYKTKPCVFPAMELRSMLASSESSQQKMPIKLGIHFVRQTKAKFDFHNICQILFDLMVAFCIIEDDNMDCILPFPMQMNGAWYSVDKNNPGAYIAIL